MPKPVKDEFIPIRSRPNPFVIRRIEAAKRQAIEAEAEAKAKEEAEAAARAETKPQEVAPATISNPQHLRRIKADKDKKP